MNRLINDGKPYTQEQLLEIRDRRRAAGDDEAADLAHAMDWFLSFADRGNDALTALGREVRRVFPVLEMAGGLLEPTSLLGRSTEALRAMLSELLDAAEAKPLARFVDGGMQIEKSHWAVHAMVESLAKSTEGALNFVEWVVGVGPREYVVTVVKPEGKRPTEVIAALKARIAELEQGR